MADLRLVRHAEARAAGDTRQRVVGRSGSRRLMLARELDMPLIASWRLHLDPAPLSACAWPDVGLIAESLNECAHLAGPAAEGRG